MKAPALVARGRSTGSAGPEKKISDAGRGGGPSLPVAYDTEMVKRANLRDVAVLSSCDDPITLRECRRVHGGN